ncbi:MAG: glycoside hydrolase family 29 (alpha-L-fucosidase) [Citrobacter freundii]|nr:MAG: glycoside hydrolase family 29 (alpha-L-fucosidase) [Citrobacter freundii]
MKKYLPVILFCILNVNANAQKSASTQALPTKQQLAWHDMEYYWFIHFGPNTFTDKEWGHGDEQADIFNPSALDCKQWARIAKASGAKGIIITAKHHDGFCLWPSQYSKHTVKESAWRNGKGDVLKELSQACKEYGLKFGVYLSPWDRNHPQYGTPAYNDVYINTMKELIARYGPFFEFWWDGANGEGPNGKKQVYDFKRFEQTMRRLAPNTVVFSDIGPDIRWVGNENGIAGETNWNYLDTAGFKRGLGAPPTDTLNQGNINGRYWIPAECDVSIRPGWFYHAEEDDKVKTPQQLFNLYLKSVGRGSTLLLNVPPDRRGLINEKDSIALMGFKKLRDESFANNFAFGSNAELHTKGNIFKRTKFTDGDEKSSEKLTDYKNTGLWVKFDSTKKINCVVLQEDITQGQFVKSAQVILLNGVQEIRKIDLTTIGRKRILVFPAQDVSSIRLVVRDAKGAPSISEVSAYNIPEMLTAL